MKTLGIGSRIIHPAFGEGVIIFVDVAAYQVCYIKHGIKLVGKNYGKWEIVEAIEPEEKVRKQPFFPDPP